ncbi:hypothetical protein SEA_CLOWN_32 [Gordonia phage Clown]|uniref:Tail assembly chaperone n=1 Tax=Gordonia phage Clown TaxID=2759393 RepID=A0A7L7SIT2_9CAUD|nr:hypothetical protein KNV25_gp32 [Gordonia phage Clown]QOC56030.1 hypothetical protein SEA_CLOWN_32 [Gordonia phage Clown]
MTAGPPWFDAAPAWSLDGRVLRLSEPSTPDMVRALLVPDTDYELSGLAVILACTPHEDDRMHVIERLYGPSDTAMSLTELQFVADELVSMFGGGLKRWTIDALWTKTMHNWAFVDGELQLGGVDVLELPFARATALVWALWRRVLRHDKDEMGRFTRELEKPPLRVIRREDEEEAAAAATAAEDSGFMALQSMWQQATASPTDPAPSDTLDRK